MPSFSFNKYNFFMWEFIKSSTNRSNMLSGHEIEVAFIGRSNVGKSSLINALTNRKSLARTSNTPGRTQLINFFQDGKKTIVDLPGYGYAKMSKFKQREMLNMIREYFETRKELKKVFVLIDTLVGPTELDLEIIEYLNQIDRDYIVVLTKSDKANQSQTHKTKVKMDKYENEYFSVSSRKGTNIPRLRKYLESIYN